MKTFSVDLPNPDELRGRPRQNSKRDYAAIATGYAQDVVAGRIPACRQAIQACQRHLNDLERQSSDPDFEYVFDPDLAARVCEFIEALPHVKGEWAARRELLRLEPWQVFCSVSIFGWVERADRAVYRFQEAYICVPRKNGKTAWTGGFALFKFVADGEFAAEVYIGAVSEDQAKRTSFKFIRAMAMRSPALQHAFGIKINVKSLVREDDGSILKPVIGNPGDGDSPSCAIHEEFHEHPTAEQYNTMKSGMGARQNPLSLIVTTAGSNRAGPCYALQRECEKVLAGTIKNERLFAVIYTADPGDDWKAIETAIKANPNYGVSVKPQYIKDRLERAIQTARWQNDYKTKNLNIWVNASVGWMNMAKWDALADPALKIEDFLGEDVEISLDLASRSDLAAKIRMFQRWIPNETGILEAHYYVFLTPYINRHAVMESGNEAYKGWETDGHLVVTPGNITDYTKIADDLVEDANSFYVRSVPHDPTHAAALVQFIQARDDWPQDVTFVEIPNTRAYLSNPMKELEALVLSGRIHHTGDPVLSWAMSNIVCDSDDRDNVFPRKEEYGNKIDPGVALIMTTRQWTLTEREGAPSIEVIEEKKQEQTARKLNFHERARREYLERLEDESYL